MHLLYLDDSGSSKNRLEEYFVLGGVSVPENCIRWLTHSIDNIAQTISTEFAKDLRKIEFHAAEIFSGKTEPWSNIKDKNERRKVILSVLSVLDHAFPTVVTFACAVHKDSFPGQDPVQIAFEDVSSRFDLYLQRISSGESRQLGIIILDKCSYESGLQNLAISFRDKGNRWGNQLRNICEVPYFVDSQACRNVQLADHIAYAVFRRYNGNDLTYFNCFESRFDKDGGIIHGLAHRHNLAKDCTCPACITRPKRI
jgi:hypothetical protein